MKKTPTAYHHPIRHKTRAESDLESLKSYEINNNISICCVHLFSDGNLGYLIRAAACFGAAKIYVIGSVPKYKELRILSCGLNNMVEIIQFRNPSEFLAYSRENGLYLVSLEQGDDATSIFDYRFPMDKKVCIVTGNETLGVPSEILNNSDVVFIPNPGPGTCMNTSQAANIGLYEYTRQRMGSKND